MYCGVDIETLIFTFPTGVLNDDEDFGSSSFSLSPGFLSKFENIPIPLYPFSDQTQEFMPFNSFIQTCPKPLHLH